MSNLHVVNYNGNQYMITKNDADISTDGCIREIIHHNEYALERFANNENKVFIDIGANCGVATIILAKQNPASIVYSFEPDKEVFEYLKRNVELNNLTNVRLFNKAVSKEGVESIELFKHPGYTGGNTTCSDTTAFFSFFKSDINVNFHSHSDVNSYVVECISLDEIIKHFNITEIELLKIDCEGAEYDILYNSEYFKLNIVKNMVGEFHNIAYNTKADNNGNRLIEYCRPYVSNLLKIGVLTI